MHKSDMSAVNGPARKLTFGHATQGVSDPAVSSLQFVGNATLLLQLGGIRVLTDPNFLHAGDHAHLGYGKQSRRLLEPAMPFEAVGPVDCILLSHYHGDHFDQEVEAKLPRDTKIVTTPHAARTLQRKGFLNAEALATWSSIDLERGGAGLRVTALPGRHGPGLVAALLPQVMGSLLEWQSGPGTRRRRLYVSGDTLVHGELHEIPRRYPDIDVAVLHLGGTRVFGVLVSLDGRGGIEALQIIGARVTIPVHYEEYTVMKSPLSDFIAEVEAAGLADRVHYLARGASLDLGAL